jgi:hypothetical protein
LYLVAHHLSRKEKIVNGRDVIKSALTSTQNLLSWYVGDLTDAEFTERPVPTANHIAWQMGHVIAGEIFLIRDTLPDAAYPELPAGFVEQHDKATSNVQPPKGFGTKAQYLDLFNKVRGTTIALLDQLTDADLDRPTQGRMAQFAPKLGDLFVLVSNHTLMHAGQFTVLRRKLGKPVVF